MARTFRGDLAELGEQLTAMCRQAAGSIRLASQALLTADLELAERVLATADSLHWQRSNCEEHARALLARPASAGDDQSVVVAAFYCAGKIESMGTSAARIARTARFGHPTRMVPADLEDVFTELGTAAAGLADRVAELISSADMTAVPALKETGRTIGALYVRVYAVVTDKGWPYPGRSATSLALLARFYKHFADQAISVAGILTFAETGAVPGVAPPD